MSRKEHFNTSGGDDAEHIRDVFVKETDDEDEEDGPEEGSGMEIEVEESDSAEEGTGGDSAVDDSAMQAEGSRYWCPPISSHYFE